MAAERPRLDLEHPWWGWVVVLGPSQPPRCCRPTARQSTQSTQGVRQSLTHLQHHTSLVCLVFGQQRQQQLLLKGRHLQALQLLRFQGGRGCCWRCCSRAGNCRYIDRLVLWAAWLAAWLPGCCAQGSSAGSCCSEVGAFAGALIMSLQCCSGMINVLCLPRHHQCQGKLQQADRVQAPGCQGWQGPFRCSSLCTAASQLHNTSMTAAKH